MATLNITDPDPREMHPKAKTFNVTSAPNSTRGPVQPAAAPPGLKPITKQLAPALSAGPNQPGVAPTAMSAASGIGAAFQNTPAMKKEAAFQKALNSPTAQANRLKATGSTDTIAQQSRPGWQGGHSYGKGVQKPAAPVGVAGAPGAPGPQMRKPAAATPSLPGATRPPIGRGMDGRPALSETAFGTGMNGEPNPIAAGYSRPGAKPAAAPGAFASTGGVPVAPGNPLGMPETPATPQDFRSAPGYEAGKAAYMEEQATANGAYIKESGIGERTRGGYRTQGRRGARAGDTMKGGRFHGKTVEYAKQRLTGEYDAKQAVPLLR